MGPFQLIILSSMIIVLLLVGWYTYSATKNKIDEVKFPPIISGCPDYWDINEAGDCVNTNNLGVGAPQTASFSDNKYKGQGGKCQKYIWAEPYNLSWDGITNKSANCNT